MDNGNNNLTNHEMYDSFYASDEQKAALKRANADGALIWPLLMMLVCIFSNISFIFLVASGPLQFVIKSPILDPIFLLFMMFLGAVGVYNMFIFMARFGGDGIRKDRFALYVMNNMPKLFKFRFIVLMSFAMAVGIINAVAGLVALITGKELGVIIVAFVFASIMLISGFVGLMIFRKKLES